MIEMTMTPRVHVAQHMARQASKQREVSQHLPRPARVRFSVNTTGVGETRLTGTKQIQFGALMLEEPTFTFGVTAREGLGQSQLPQCTAIVLRYTQNDQGAYTGAEVGFAVNCAKSNVKLKFSLTFEGSTLRSTLGTQATNTAEADNTFTGSAPAVPIEVELL